MTPFWFLVSGLTMFQNGQRWSSDKYVYLIDSPGSYTRETMKAYSSLEAYQQFFNGWVRTCYLLEVSNALLLKANEGKSDEVSSSRSSSDRFTPCSMVCLWQVGCNSSHSAPYLYGRVSILYILLWHISAYSKEICSVWLSCTVMTVLPSQY